MAGGVFDSSITRVRPFFQQLLQRDDEWLAALLSAAPNKPAHLAAALKQPGPIDAECRRLRVHTQAVLGRKRSFPLAVCFESRQPAPKPFLEYLIRHSDEVPWHPSGNRMKEPGRTRRRQLLDPMNQRGRALRQAEALRELERVGSRPVQGRAWWILEGPTEVDCVLETPRLRIFVEGKRTESLSGGVCWYPARNQLVRNLEVAKEVAGPKAYAVLLLTEKAMTITSEEVQASLPHYDRRSREELMSHFLGNVTWRDACTATRVEFASLPETAHDVFGE